MKNKYKIILLIILLLTCIFAYKYFFVEKKISTYEIAKQNGFSGSEKEWVSSLKGEDGLNGKDGYTPIKGVDYFDGINGTNGINGKDGIDGTNGINGIDGTNGQDGYTPIKGVDYFDGANGKDGTNGTNGINGIDGTNGQDGYTPIKGVDYFDGTNGQDGYTPLKGVDYFDGLAGPNEVSTSTNTNITGLLKGNGSKIVQAEAGVDYLSPFDLSSDYLKIDGSNSPITGNLTVKPITDSTTGFSVQDKDSNVVLDVDTENNRVGIGTNVPAATFDLLGTARIGDHVTNYTEFEADGTLKMNGSSTVWDDLRVIILTRTGSVAPSFTSGFAGNANLYTYNFKNGQTNNVYFEIQMPHSWAGTTIYPHVHWSPITTGTGNVRWYFEYTWVNINGTFGESQTLLMDHNVDTNSQWKHILSSNPTGIVPTASQKGLSSMMICRLYRTGGSGADTLAADVSLVAFDVHFEMDTIGSRDVITK